MRKTVVLWPLLTLAAMAAAQSPDEVAVLAAVRSGDSSQLAELLASGAGPDVRDAEYMNATALMIAAERDNIDCGRLLLNAGADPDALDIAGDTALNWAAYYGHLPTVLMLLDAGADPALTGHGNTLEIALRRGHEALLEPLATRLGILQPVSTLDRPVLEASRSGNDQFLGTSLAAGGSPDARDEYGRPALQLAAAGGHQTTVSILLEDGAEIDAIDPIGFTALMVAGREAYTAVSLDLLMAGADPGHKALPVGLSLTPLHLAAIGGDIALAEALLESGADINAQGAAGNTPAIWALGEGRMEMILALLDLGADPDVVNHDGDTLRTMARTWAIEPILEVLDRPRD